MRLPFLFLLPMCLSCAGRRAPAPLGAGSVPEVHGPRRAELDLYRVVPAGDRIYVEADPGDGVSRMFLVDTGSSVTVLSPQVARTLGIQATGRSTRVQGMGGLAEAPEARLDVLRLGPYEVRNLRVAIGVPGVPEWAGPVVPLAGLIGSDVWSRFQVAIDYPANLMELARPGYLSVPAIASAMIDGGQHPRVPVTLYVAGPDGPIPCEVELEVDTASTSVVIGGPLDAGLAALAASGTEPVVGAGSRLGLPTREYLQATRRLTIVAVETGSVRIEREIRATWLGYDESEGPLGSMGMRGLLGHAALDGYRVLIDAPGGRFAVLPSERPARHLDIQERALERLGKENHAGALLDRANLLAFLNRLPEAERLVRKALEQEPENVGARVMLAHVARRSGRFDEALEMMRVMSPEVLVEEHEIVATVNGLWLRGRGAEGLAMAEAATQIAPKRSESWIALADARRAAGDRAGAREALHEANRIEEDPDGNPLRRAWLSEEDGDAYAAMTHARRWMMAEPLSGVPAWYYALLVAGRPEEDLFRADLDAVMGALHADVRPLDFLAAVHRALGEPEEALRLMELGRDRDCPEARDDASRANCEAWYLAMAGRELERATRRIDEAIAARPDRSEFYDTKAVVAEAKGDLGSARDAAWRAASLAPDDPYLLWQAVRMAAAADGASRATGTGG